MYFFFFLRSKIKDFPLGTFVLPYILQIIIIMNLEIKFMNSATSLKKTTPNIFNK